MLKCKCPKAKLSNNTLALSLPDAMTPVVWVMDMNSEGTFIIKVEEIEDGYFALQKISTKGKSETIAFYKKKYRAVKAMGTITRALDNSAKSSLFGFIRSLLSIVIIAGIVYGAYLVLSPVMSFLGSLTDKVATHKMAETQPQAPENTQKQETIVIERKNTNEAVGVPMSADDFLKNQGPRLPF